MKKILIGCLVVLIVITNGYLIYRIYEGNQTILSYGRDLPTNNNYSLTPNRIMIVILLISWDSIFCL